MVSPHASETRKRECHQVSNSTGGHSLVGKENAGWPETQISVLKGTGQSTCGHLVEISGPALGRETTEKDAEYWCLPFPVHSILSLQCLVGVRCGRAELSKAKLQGRGDDPVEEKVLTTEVKGPKFGSKAAV